MVVPVHKKAPSDCEYNRLGACLPRSEVEAARCQGYLQKTGDSLTDTGGGLCLTTPSPLGRPPQPVKAGAVVRLALCQVPVP